MNHEHLYALSLQVAQAILHRLKDVRLARVVHVHGVLGSAGARVDNPTLLGDNIHPNYTSTTGSTEAGMHDLANTDQAGITKPGTVARSLCIL